MVWKPDRLLRSILIWTAITFIIVWLPFVRGLMDGNTYEWGNYFFGMQFGGRGVHGDYWLLVIQAVFGILLLYLVGAERGHPFTGCYCAGKSCWSRKLVITRSLRLKITGFKATRSVSISRWPGLAQCSPAVSLCYRFFGCCAICERDRRRFCPSGIGPTSYFS